MEEVFFELQKIHRQNERELNRIKFALKRESDRLNLESQQKYKSELEKASLQYKRMFSQYKEWQIKESDRVSKLKIIIPDALQTTYEKLSLLEEYIRLKEADVIRYIDSFFTGTVSSVTIYKDWFETCLT